MLDVARGARGLRQFLTGACYSDRRLWTWSGTLLWSTRRQTKDWVSCARPKQGCLCDRDNAGLLVLTGEVHRRNGRRRWRVEVDEADVTGHSWANQWHGDMRQDVWSMCAWLMRLGAVSSRRNRLWTSSEQRVLGEKLGRPGGVIGEGARGEMKKGRWQFILHGQGEVKARHYGVLNPRNHSRKRRRGGRRGRAGVDDEQGEVGSTWQ